MFLIYLDELISSYFSVLVFCLTILYHAFRIILLDLFLCVNHLCLPLFCLPLLSHLHLFTLISSLWFLCQFSLHPQHLRSSLFVLPRWVLHLPSLFALAPLFLEYLLYVYCESASSSLYPCSFYQSTFGSSILTSQHRRC